MLFAGMLLLIVFTGLPLDSAGFLHEGDTFLRNVGQSVKYMAVPPRRPYSSSTYKIIVVFRVPHFYMPNFAG
jgi:hypothetical protein